MPAPRRQSFLRGKWTPTSRTKEFFYGQNEKIFTFMVARHPFERILSAYRLLKYQLSFKMSYFLFCRDKFFVNSEFSTENFEKEKAMRFKRMYGNEILRKYRKTTK